MGGDDGAGGELTARRVIGVTPGVVEASEAEELTVFTGDAILHLASHAIGWQA
jgi:hypothetical protein